MSAALIDRQAFINLFDPLLKLSPNMRVEPNLVTKWSISGGGTVYDLFLRHGVLFQDGTPFNAASVIYNWQWEMDPAHASPRRSNLSLVKSLSSPNPYEVVVTLKAPFAPFLNVLTGRVGMISSPAAIQKYGPQYGLHPTGTGPFELRSWIKNDHMIMVRNPKYWKPDLPYLSKVVYTPITNQVQEYNALTTKQVSLIDTLPNQDLSSVASAQGINSSVKPGLGYSDVVLNNRTAPFNNIHNRQAINYAIDRSTYNKLIYFGKGVPAYSQFGPTSWAYSKSVKVPFSDSMARTELARAGNPNGFTFSLTGANDPVDVEAMQAIQGELAKVGIHMNIIPVDNTVLLADAAKANFQGELIGWSGRPDPDQNSYAFDTTGGSFNWAGYSNPTVDSLLLKAREAQTTASRARYYVAASKIVLDQAPYVFLSYPPNAKAWSSSLHDFQNYEDGLMRLTKVWLGA